MKLFLQKNAKFLSAGGSAPRPPQTAPPLRISGYAPGRLTARSTGFLQKVFVHCSTLLTKIFQNGGGMGEELKFVTWNGGLKKKTQKNFCVFLQQ